MLDPQEKSKSMFPEVSSCLLNSTKLSCERQLGEQPGTHIPGLQLMHCWFHLFVSQCADNGVQYSCKNRREHREDFIHWEAAERPGINENTGPKKESHYSDVGSQNAAGFGYTHWGMMLYSD